MDCQRRRNAVVDDANADDNAERDTDDCDVPWEALGTAGDGCV